MTAFDPPALQRRLTNAPVEFMENRMVMPSSGPPMSYVDEMGMFMTGPQAKDHEKKSAELWNAALKDKEELIAAITAFRTKLSSKDPSITLSDLATCSWKEVMEEFTQAVEHYEREKTKGKSGAVVKCLRKLGKHEKNFAGWIDMLPAGDYGGAICGAFKLVLGAAGRMHQIRTYIYSAISDIPEAISLAQRYLKIYSDQKAYELKQKTVELYRAVLKALTNIARYFTESSAKRIGKALFQRDDYEEDIMESIGAVKSCATELNEEALRCMQLRARRLDENIVAGLRMTKTLDKNVQQVDKKVEQMSENVENLKTTLYACVLQQLRGDPSLDRRTDLPVASTDETKSRRSSMKEKHARKAKLLLEEEAKGISVEELLASLQYDADLLGQDVSELRSYGETMSDEEKDRATFLANSDALRSWLLESRQSRALLVNGNSVDQATDARSPLSFIVAQLTHLCADFESAVVLGYFCGQHAGWQDPRANAAGLMHSLVGQLLSRSDLAFDLSFVNDKTRTRLERNHLKTLCATFRRLLLQLPRSMVVFCFVDTIPMYETSERREETRSALHTLMRIVNAGEKTAVFKLLVTAPGRSLYSHEQINDVFEMPEEIDGDRQGVVLLDGLENPD